MNDGKPFSHPRWNDPPKAKRMGGHHEFTEEEKKEGEAFLNKKIEEYEKMMGINND